MSITSKDLQRHFETKLEAEVGPIGLKHLMEAEKGKITILDVRRPEHFAQERIPGAVHMTLEELQKNYGKLPKKNRIVTYCYTFMCALAPKAALFLAKKGFKVTELVGGIESWKKAGYDIETPSGIRTQAKELASAQSN